MRTTRYINQISAILTALDIDLIGRETGKIIAQIKLLAADVRLDVRDFEMAENRVEMEQNASSATRRIDELRALILKASEHGIFGAVDVAQISAHLDEIAAELQ